MLASTRAKESLTGPPKRFSSGESGSGKRRDWDSSGASEPDFSVQMPDASETEYDVIGSCLAEGLSWWRAVEREGGSNVADLFYDPDLYFVAEAMTALAEDNHEINLTAVADVLLTDPRSARLTPDVQTYLAGLLSRGTARKVADLQSAARRLAEKRASRGLITGLDKIRSAAVDGAHPNDVASSLRQLSLEGGVTEDVQLMGEVVDLMELDDSLGATWRIPTGISALDKYLHGGLEPGRFYCIGARPKIGKSMLLLNIVLEALASGATVLFVSMEMGRREIWSRLLAAQAYVDQKRIQDWLKGAITDEDFEPDEWERLDQARADLKAAPLYALFIDQIRHGGDSVVSAAMSVLAKTEPGTPVLVAADYLQLFIKGTKDVRIEIAEITRMWKKAALELQICFVTPSQISRGGAEDGMPHPHHLKESGNIEQDADAVIMMNRPSEQDENIPAHHMDLWLALNRNGPTGWVKAYCNLEKATVSNLTEEWSAASEDGDGGDGDRDDRSDHRSEERPRSRADEVHEKVERGRREVQESRQPPAEPRREQHPRSDRRGEDRPRRERDESGRRPRRTAQHAVEDF